MDGWLVRWIDGLVPCRLITSGLTRSVSNIGTERVERRRETSREIKTERKKVARRRERNGDSVNLV